MPRKKGGGEGTLQKKRIAGREVWWARWVAYDGDGNRRRPERIVGDVADYPTKRDARDRLNEIIREASVKIPPAPTGTTFADIWKRYAAHKSKKWSRANTKTIHSIFNRVVLPAIGDREIGEITPEPLQSVLNNMVDMPVGQKKNADGGFDPARQGYGFSAMQKVLRYLRATFNFAIEEELIEKDPTRRLEIPEPPRESAERYLSLAEVGTLLSAAQGRERLTLRLLIVCGLRPGELFALRPEDIEPGRIRIDEAVKESERVGPRKIGKTKTDEADSYVAMSEDLERELRNWATTRPTGSLLFATGRGTPWRIGNYLKRVLKPLAEQVGIQDLTHQALRRTFATLFQHHGTVRDAQAQLRHSDPETTLRYYQHEIPESVRAAVERFDKAIRGMVN